MKQVGIYEAKTHFPRLVQEVEQGETIVITKYGRPVARLVPEPERKSIPEVIAAFRELRRGKHVTIEEIREWIQEGRM